MNKVVEFEARTSIERQAREWLVRMDGDKPLTEVELEALREWIHRSVLHREELKRMCKFWRQANVLTELALCLQSGAQERTRRGERRAPAIAIAASALLVSTILAWWSLYGSDWTTNGSYRTGIGQQKLITLSDGSSVRLNTNSQMQVNYSKGSRTLRLLQGEALFSVIPDPNRAFEVYAGDNVVRAVGTAFAVHLDGSKVDVTVTKGVVDVAEVNHRPIAAPHRKHLKGDAPTLKGDAPTASLGRLKAGEMTRVGSGTDHIEVQQLAEPELQRKMSWQEGYLTFSGEPLSEVIQQVNRYSPVTLELGDPNLASVAIGGRFRIGDMDAVLDVLETNFGVQAHRVDEHSIKLESAPGH